MTKIVYNGCYGGFSLSDAAMRRYAEIKGMAYDEMTLGSREFERDDPALVQVVEELGDAANGMCAKLHIEDVPKGTLWRIDEYDGFESVATQDSCEWKVA